MVVLQVRCFPTSSLFTGRNPQVDGKKVESAEDEVEEVLEISGAHSAGIRIQELRVQELWTRLW